MNDTIIDLNYPFDSDKVFQSKVIITTTKRRGNGTQSDPIRIITEVFTKDGVKIAEKDPCKPFD
jgi:hypothetical protein